MLKRMETILLSMVAWLHIYFYYVEMFRWTDPKVAEGFGLTQQAAELSALVAANQGVYNLMLALGLFVALALKERATHLVRYILAFICVVGLYGAYTVSLKILLIQVVPAILALGVHTFRQIQLAQSHS